MFNVCRYSFAHLATSRVRRISDSLKSSAAMHGCRVASKLMVLELHHSMFASVRALFLMESKTTWTCYQTVDSRSLSASPLIGFKLCALFFLILWWYPGKLRHPRTLLMPTVHKKYLIFQHVFSPCHLRLVLLSILNARFEDFMIHFGLVCSSFVTISKGTHWRCPSSPLGLPSAEFVRQGNEFTAKSLDCIRSSRLYRNMVRALDGK